MTKRHSTKKALMLSLLSLIVCVSMLVGSTFAWFTDSVTSSGNKIQSGTLKLDLELLDKETGWDSIKESKAPIFDYDLWEPGYTDVKILKVENEGTLALKWYAKFVSENDLSILADVIDVYVCPSATELTYPADRNLDGYEKVGTVRDFVNTIESTTNGNLKAGEVAYLGIALKMQEEAGNDYQGLTLGAFDIMILATQDTIENDSFDDQYDADAEYDKVQLPAKNVTVTSQEEFNAAFAEAAKGDREVNIDATGVTLEITEVMANGSAAATEIPAGVTIKGATFSPTHRGGNYILMSAGANEQVVFENCIFDNAGNNLVIGSTVDGPDSVIYNNCTFTGSVITNFVDNPDGVAEFNVCRFTKATSGLPMRNFVEGMGGTHNFNGCTFDYTGVTQSSMGVISSGCVNVYSESGYSTTVVLNGCTRISCGTRTYGPNSSLVIK
ncbi:MAG: hypothetical protein IJP16_02535 [Clostridia bacterium]|nr:hypothetical protein [Clostridia bacterium]